MIAQTRKCNFHSLEDYLNVGIGNPWTGHKRLDVSPWWDMTDGGVKLASLGTDPLIGS